MAYAYPGDVAPRWRTLTTEEAYSASVLLERVSAVMRLNSAGLDDRIAGDPDLAIVASGIAVDAVLRVLRNPDGKVQEAIDDYSYRRADAVADGVLYLTPSELAQLAPGGTTARGAFTITPGPSPAGRYW